MQKIKIIDWLVYVLSLIGPLSMIPSIIEITTTKNAVGHSLLTWLFWWITAAAWVLWGIVHKQTTIVWTQALWVIAEAIFIACLIHYGSAW